MTTLLIYTNTSKQVGDPDHLKVFADEAAADEWFRENDKEGVAFAYPVIEKSPARKPGRAAFKRWHGL